MNVIDDLFKIDAEYIIMINEFIVINYICSNF